MNSLEHPNISPSSSVYQALMQGRLEELGLSRCSFSGILQQLAGIQETVQPSIDNPVALIFSGSHDFVQHHYPNLLYHQENLFSNIINKESSVIKLAKNNCKVKLVDVGFQSDYRQYLNFWLRMEELMELPGHWEPSSDFSRVTSLSNKLVRKAMKEGARLTDKFFQRGSNTLVLTDLGPASWFSSYALAQALSISSFSISELDALLQHKFGDLAPDAQRLSRKLNLPLRNNPKSNDALTLMSLYGSTELAMLTGAILKGASLKMTLVLDGFTSQLAAKIAETFHENASDYCLFAHLNRNRFVEHTVFTKGMLHISDVDFLQMDGSNGVFALQVLRQYCNLLT